MEDYEPSTLMKRRYARGPPREGQDPRSLTICSNNSKYGEHSIEGIYVHPALQACESEALLAKCIAHKASVRLSADWVHLLGHFIALLKYADHHIQA